MPIRKSLERQARKTRERYGPRGGTGIGSDRRPEAVRTDRNLTKRLMRNLTKRLMRRRERA